MTFVDLHIDEIEAETGGIVTFRNGCVFYSLAVGQDQDGDYEIRTAHAEFLGYTRDGQRCDLCEVDGKKRWVRNDVDGENDFDVLAFRRCSYADAMSCGITNNFREAMRAICPD